MRKIASILLLSVILWGCKNDKPAPQDSIKNRTVLVYMIADNNLYRNALDDINEMESAWNESYDGTVLVFLNAPNKPSRLYKITKGNNDKIESAVIKEYPVDQDPADAKTLTDVIADVRSLSQTNSYALMLWSHGSGWLPEGLAPLRSSEAGSIENYSFGVTDRFGTEMELDALAAALPKDLVFDYIEFDACYMASIEATYQLRSNAKYVISSSAETFVAGMPYDEIMADMMSKEANVTEIAKKFYDYYNAFSGASQSATISVIECAKLPAIATALNEIVTASPRGSSQITYGSIQQFGRSIYTNIFYDLGDFVNQTWQGDPKLGKFNTAMDAATLYKAATPMLFSQITVNKHCGITAFIPRTGQGQAFTEFTERFDWAKDSGLSKITF